MRHELRAHRALDAVLGLGVRVRVRVGARVGLGSRLGLSLGLRLGMRLGFTLGRALDAVRRVGSALRVEGGVVVRVVVTRGDDVPAWGATVRGTYGTGWYVYGVRTVASCPEPCSTQAAGTRSPGRTSQHGCPPRSTKCSIMRTIGAMHWSPSGAPGEGQGQGQGQG